DGVNGPLEPWDWRFYAARVRERRHAIDEETVKPFLSLDNVIAAAFDVAGRLFGLTAEPFKAPLWHPDVRAWRFSRNGREMAVFLGDYLARPGKRSGAWCSALRPQHALGEGQRAIVVNVCNFTPGADGGPALLSWDDARTVFHEFGHALHHILSDVTHPSISGTSVARDFVELPSQLYEHWLEVPEVLATHARHVDSGAGLDPATIARLIAVGRADAGFATVEYLQSALVDLALHRGAPPDDPMARQAEVLAALGAPAAIPMRHAVPQFQHVFAGDGYSAGYYSYLWAEVMDADAFAAFEEAGDPFDPETARRLERSILSRGGSRPADALWREFRERKPGVAALLRGRGLLPVVSHEGVTGK
nr:M3 family metallopeptidase [Paracoccus sp. (in: a-proteobacteria)]